MRDPKGKERITSIRAKGQGKKKKMNEKFIKKIESELKVN
jgi:hypothetical protein